MTVRIYQLLEEFVPGVKVDADSPPVQVVLNNRRRWSREQELVEALEARGYTSVGLLGGFPAFMYEGTEGKKVMGRPPLDTLEEQAEKKFLKKVSELV